MRHASTRSIEPPKLKISQDEIIADLRYPAPRRPEGDADAERSGRRA